MDVRQATTLAHLPEGDTIKLLLELDAATPGFIAVHQWHLHHRGLDFGSCKHEDLTEACYTESDIHLTATGCVERVQCHLGRRLTD